MPIFPFLDDEAKRRRFLTPGINGELPEAVNPKPLPGITPNIPPSTPTMMPGRSYPSSLPEAPEARPLPALINSGGAPPTGPMPGPLPAPIALTPPSQLERYRAEKESYLRDTPGRFKSGLLGALKGGLQGLASGQGLGGLVGGAIAGGGFGASDPRGLREQQFETAMRPKILERFAMENEERAQQAAGAKAAMDQVMNQAQLANMQSQIDERVNAGRRADQELRFKENQPRVYKPGDYVADPRGREKAFQVPITPKSPTSAELATDPDDGSSVEEKARASYEARGGDSYVYDRLPERTRRVLEDDKGAYGPAEVAAAQREFDNARNRQWQADLSYTKGAIRSKVLGKRGDLRNATSPGYVPQRKGQPGRTAISVSEAAELLK